MTPKKFPTKARMEVARIHNSHNIANLTEQKIWICFSPADYDRGGYGSAHYSVIHIGYKTDPDGPWYNHGNKTFLSLSKSKEEILPEAIIWTNEKFGSREWVRDPWGSYQDASALELAWAQVKAAEAEAKNGND